MKKTVFLKQEFRGKKWENSSLPESIEIVGEGRSFIIYKNGEHEMKIEEDVFIAKDMFNYPKHFIEQYYL